MAKIILSVDIQKQKAIQGLGELEGKIKEIAQSLSTVTIKNSLLSDIDALTAKFKTLADQSDRLAGKTAKQAIENERLNQAQIKTQITTVNLQTAEERLAKAKILTQTASVNLAIAQERLAKSQKQTQITAVNLQAAEERLKKSHDNNAKSATTLQSQVNGLQKKYADLLSTIKSLEKQYPAGTFDSLKNETQGALTTLENYNSKLKNGEAANEAMLVKIRELSSGYNNLSTSIATTRVETEQQTTTVERNTAALKKSGDSITSLIKKFLVWQLSATLVMKPLQAITGALRTLNETLVKTEDTVIAFQRVMPGLADEEISSALYGLAQDYGQTFENVQAIALDFARTGLSWEDTIKATEAALLGLNTAELDATNASAGLIAILTQYKIEASELESVIDKLNITQDNAAVTTDKLLTALQRMGSSATNANLSLEESIALITALSAATGRSGENLGTALNSLIQYSTKASALNVFASLSDNVADVVAEYKKGAASILDVWYAVSDEIQHLTVEQADKLDAYFDTEDGSALKDALAGDLEEIYDDLAGVYTTANTFRKNYFIALLGNMEEVKASLSNMDGSDGYSMLQNEDYLDTYTAKLNALNAQWQEFLNGAQSILTIKKIGVDAASGLLTVADALDKVHLLMPLVATGAVLLGTVLRNKAMSEAAARVNAYSSALIKNKTATIADATAISKLTIKQKQQVIQDIAAAAASGKLTGAQAKQVITEAGLSTALTKLSAKKKAKIQATIQEAVVSGTLTAAQGAEITTSLGLTAANTGLSVSFKAVAASIKSLLASIPIIGWILLAVTAVIEIIQAIVQCCNDNADAAREEIKATTEEAVQAIETINDAVDALNEANEALQDNIASLEMYADVLGDASASEEERTEALNELIKLSNQLRESYGVENDYLTSLRVGYDDLTGSVKQYIESVRTAAALKSQSDYEDAQKQLEDAKEYLGNAIDNTMGGGDKNEMKELKDSFDYAGISGYDKFVNNDTIQIGYSQENLDLLRDWQDKLTTALKVEAARNGKSSSKYKELHKAWSGVRDVANDIESTLKDIENIEGSTLDLFAKATVLNNETLSSLYYGAMGTSAEAGDAYDELKKIIKETTDYTDEQKNAIIAFINEGLSGYIGKYKAHVEEWANDISKVTSLYGDLIDKLKALRDAEKSSNEWEEKKLSVLEAQKEVLEAQRALENAKNEATIRRFNTSTGQWEWQTDEKKIAEAQDKIESAEASLLKAQQNLQEAAYNKIIELLESGQTTNDEVVGVLNEVAPYLLLNTDYASEMAGFAGEMSGLAGGIAGAVNGMSGIADSILEVSFDIRNFTGELPSFFTDILGAIKDVTKVDVTQPIKDTPPDYTPIPSVSAPQPEPEPVKQKSEVDIAKDKIVVLKGASGKGINKSKVGDNSDVTWAGVTYKIENAGETNDETLKKAIAEMGLADRSIFGYDGEIYGCLDGGIVRLRKQDGWSSFWNDNGKNNYDALKKTAASVYGVFDSGGIAGGSGFMAKPTERPETINDPDLTSMILSPKRNAEWDKYVSDMGIMFEKAHKYSQSPMTQSNFGNTDNRVDNSGQVIVNGMTVSENSQTMSVAELFSLAKIIPNK